MAKHEALKNHIEALRDAIPELKGVLLASNEGLPIAHSLSNGSDPTCGGDGSRGFNAPPPHAAPLPHGGPLPRPAPGPPRRSRAGTGCARPITTSRATAW